MSLRNIPSVTSLITWLIGFIPFRIRLSTAVALRLPFCAHLRGVPQSKLELFIKYIKWRGQTHCRILLHQLTVTNHYKLLDIRCLVLAIAKALRHAQSAIIPVRPARVNPAEALFWIGYKPNSWRTWAAN
jgi:hypothetical protein